MMCRARVGARECGRVASVRERSIIVDFGLFLVALAVLICWLSAQSR